MISPLRYELHANLNFTTYRRPRQNGRRRPSKARFAEKIAHFPPFFLIALWRKRKK
jgi:hypothetical protein